jgi:hypothetical protein
MEDYGDEWQYKGATFSDKSARKEFGLSQDEIYAAIKAGKLQYRVASMHGNPWFRLLRREVEALVKERHGADHLKTQRAKAELAGIERELRQLKKRVAGLEARRTALRAELERIDGNQELKQGGGR